MMRDRHAESLQLALSREAAGERVVWQAGRIARIDRRAFGIYLFAVPWTAFALFWTTMAAGATRSAAGQLGVLSYAFPLFGVPFIAVGLGMMAAPFYGLWTGSRTLYAATDRRMLRIRMGRSLKVESVPLERLGAVERTERPDGSGSLSYAVRVGADSDGDARVERFEVADVADVFEASRRIERAIAAGGARGVALSS